MKPDFPPPPPGDEAADPLLSALRQRLGDYGQAPPPGAWAAIRRQVAPAALPQPWWRRRPPLVLLGLLLLCCLLPSKLAEYATQHRAGLAAGAHWPQLAKPTTSLPAPAAVGERAGRSATSVAADESAATLHSPVSSPSYLVKSPAEATSSLAQAATTKKSIITKAAKALPPATTAARLARSRPQPAGGGAGAAAATSAPATSLAAAAWQRETRKLTLARAPAHPARSQPLSHGAAGRHPHTTEPTAASPAAETYANAWRTDRLARRDRVATQTVALRAGAHRNAASTATHFATGHDATATRRTTAYLASASSLADRQLQKNRRHALRAGRTTRPAATDALLAAAPADALAPLATALASNSFPFGPVDLLALRQAGLLLPTAAAPVPATLVARPDTTPPVLPARRWALLIVAGPTLSYRTLGPAPALAAGHPDFARLERPALGLGAQVQVRRVLSGRWALAAGLGYHEYATRLALNLRDTLSVHQRDTYRLLTVPVQLGYALGTPKGRLTKALLLGLEPGWYLGGRSTEGSGCGCEQQGYSAAGGSPYRSLTVALSLGLDVRLRLGSAGSRWQWLVQPTGRYVATPFVRADAVGFTQRQPFSLGLLTGFSWDLR